ncbi:MAG TPA: uracil-DNA glycosylase family protein [Candidatus Melainabacteria bacterium]|jgi:uracil-DNA glycosylase|nr:uracil-DNA glycosylase family protein [Candidatus Melainabacteria bacterium]HIN63555.1 uracil-DNA glycosylase family protein [Candidatus Obscuribacterales bacterium]
MTNAHKLLLEIKSCTICLDQLPLGPRPILQASDSAKILIAGQAPGKRVHQSGVPFDDQSGDRLRNWLGMTKEQFYDAGIVAILPMGFCYPGSGKSGDAPPRPECAKEWRERLLNVLPHLELTLLIGKYAIDYHLAGVQKDNLTNTVKAWRDYWPSKIPMPHPSPRNNIWFRQNPWFEKEVLPVVKQRVRIITQNN